MKLPKTRGEMRELPNRDLIELFYYCERMYGSVRTTGGLKSEDILWLKRRDLVGQEIDARIRIVNDNVQCIGEEDYDDDLADLYYDPDVGDR